MPPEPSAGNPNTRGGEVPAVVMRRLVLEFYRRAYRLARKCGVSKTPPVRRALDGIASFLKSGLVQVHGQKMLLDPDDSLWLLRRGVCHPVLTALVKEQVKDGDVVLDVGAHIGYFTLIFAKLAGESGRVFSFEPDPRNFALLKENVRANGHRNVILEQKAVSNRSGRARLYVHPHNTALNTIYDPGKNRESIDVDVVRLDDYFSDYHDKIDFIKIDVEGVEVEVLEGMSSLLGRYGPLRIVTEFEPPLLARVGIDPAAYLDLLAHDGFELYDVNEKRAATEPIAAAAFLGGIATHEGYYHTNLFAVRRG